MKNLNFKKEILPNLLILVAFIVAAIIYCYPELEGKKIAAADSLQPRSAVEDGLRYHEETGDYTWWNSSMFSGMPNYQIGGGGGMLSSKILYPFTWFFRLGHRHVIPILIFYFIAFFVLMRTFKIDKWISLAGAFATAFSSYFFIIIAAAHHGKCSTIAWTTLVIVGFILVFRKQYGWGALFIMFFMAMAFTVHPQMAYYLCMLIGVLYCAELYIHIKEKRIKDLLIGTGIFAGAFLVGLGINGASVFSNQEYVKETMRGGHSELVKETDSQNSTGDGLDLDYATQWSYGIDETLTFLVPNMMGGANGYSLDNDSKLYTELVRNGVPRGSAQAFCSAAPTYWGDQPFTAGPVYMGAIVCFLFVLSLFLLQGPYKWALLVATIFSILLSWGYHFMPLTELFFNYFPVYNKFRAVSSILIVAEITIPLMAFWGLKTITEGSLSKEKVVRAIYYSVGITGGICLLLALFGGSLFSFTSRHDAQFVSQIPEFAYDAIIAQRQSMLVADAWRSLFFVVVGAALTWLYAQGKLKTMYFGLLLAVFVLIDMWPVDKRYFNDNHFEYVKKRNQFFEKLPYEEYLLKDTDPNFRVMNLTVNSFNDARTSYYLRSVGGYCAAKLRRYQDLIDEHLSKMHMPVYNMLNTKYFIVKDKAGNAVPQLNPEAMGNAWFVNDVKVVDNANEESDALMQIDLHTTAVTDKSFAHFIEGWTPSIDSLAIIRLTSCTPKELFYKTTASEEQIAVFSEIYYPYGWKAFIDGEPVEHFRVNYLLRALRIPAGEHEVHFIFDPDSIKKGDMLASICIAIMFLTAIATIVMYVLRRRKEKA